MNNDNRCLFVEPWQGQCQEKRVEGEIFCCEKHAKEKCQVCGREALTRCQASIGVLCGIPLCSDCGHGEMCLHHASEGPLAIIRGLLGGGAVRSVLATEEDRRKQEKEIEERITLLRKHRFNPPLPRGA